MRDPAQTNELASIAREASGGDPDAFRRLVDRTHRTLYRLAYRMLDDRDGAEEVVQETCIRAWQGIGDLRDPEAVMGWLCRIARNVATDQLRVRYRRPARSLDEPGPENRTAMSDNLSHPGPGPEQQLASAQVDQAVRAALAGLKDKHRIVLQLREIDQMSYEEIAVALGCRLGTVESRLHRARLALARGLRGLARELGQVGA